MRQIYFSAILALLPIGGWAQETGAGGATEDTFGDFLSVCDSAGGASAVTCRLVQSLSITETGALVARLLVYPQENGGAILVAHVPMGAYLPDGAVYRPSEPAETADRRMVWQRCAQDICEAALAVDADELDLLESGGGMLFGYRPAPGGDPVIVEFATAELVGGLSSLRNRP